MEDRANLIERLIRKVRLPTATLESVRSALADTTQDPSRILMKAGLSRSQIKEILQPSPPEADVRPPVDNRSRTEANARTNSVRTVSTVSDEPSVDDLIARLLDITPRYELQGEIARGAMGRILAGWDLHLGRPVAVKVLRKTAAKDFDRVRFLEEAQVTGQLQHPNIMPLHELGRLRDQVAFVMKRVEGTTLKQIITSTRRGDLAIMKKFPRGRLISAFRQLCMAVSFAHSQGVVHRDLKPSNVMMGDFGEIMLLDWGLCKIMGAGARSTRSTSERWKTVQGQIIGTPAYMAPEQAGGLISEVDARTDVYGLGAILYHLLTYRPPFTGKSNREIVNRVLEEEVIPARVRAPQNRIPEALETICSTALARSPTKRYQTAEALGDAIQGYLDKPSASAIPTQVKEIETWVKEGRTSLESKDSLLEDAAILSHTIEMELANTDLLDSAKTKMASRTAERALEKVNAHIARANAKAIHFFTQALGADPEHISARTGLVELLTSELESARFRGNPDRVAFYRSLLAQHDRGFLSDLLEGRGSLHLDVHPSTADIHLSKMDVNGTILLPDGFRKLENPPIEIAGLSDGIYALTLDSPGHSAVKTTFSIIPGKCTRLRIRLVRHDQVPEGFVHIPAGTFMMGPRNMLSRMPTEQALPDFLIQRYPVTAGEYLVFLRSVNKTDPETARKRLPRLSSMQHALWPDHILHGGAIEDQMGWSGDIPVVGISASDAIAYSRWLGEQIGHRLRLPSEEEWEKSARGSEGRSFPWGNHWNPALCGCPESWPHELPPKVTDFKHDRSTSLVHGLAGGVREWSGSRAAGKIERLIVKGGSFRSGSSEGRPLWTRDSVTPKFSTMDLGFRLVAEINS